jgi:tRNA 2-selenouridine synthase SelU
MKKTVESKEKLLEEFFRHHLAHSAKIAAGKGQRGCQFCPTLKLKAGSSRRGLMRAEIFAERFYRTLAKELNKIDRMARSGHVEASKFMHDLEKMVKEKPWDKPPASPGAILEAPLGESAQGALSVA